MFCLNYLFIFSLFIHLFCSISFTYLWFLSDILRRFEISICKVRYKELYIIIIIIIKDDFDITDLLVHRISRYNGLFSTIRCTHSQCSSPKIFHDITDFSVGSQKSVTLTVNCILISFDKNTFPNQYQVSLK